MAIVVTGAAGFIGSHLVERLCANSQQVVGIDRRPMSARHGFVPVLGDLSDPSRELATALQQAKVVYHLAGCPGVRDHSNDVEWRRQRDNVLATKHVAALTPLDSLVVLASSSSVYGGSNGRPCKETDQPTPRGGYARSKLAAEDICRARERDGGSTVIARLFTVAGERQRSDMAISIWLNNAFSGEAVTVFGSLARTRDITDVRDVVDALVELAHVKADGIVNIGTGTAYSLSQITEAIEAAVGGPIAVDIRPATSDDPDATLADTTRLKELTGLCPTTNLQSLVRRQAHQLLNATHGKPPGPGPRTLPLGAHNEQ